MTFNDDGSLRCNLCNSDPCVCGKPKNPSREAFEEWWKTICDATPREEKLLAAIRPYALGGFKAALAWKAEQEKTDGGLR